METRFKCVVCGKLTAGRLGRNGKHVGDTSHRFSRRHKVNGKDCPGNILDAEWVDISNSNKLIQSKTINDWYILGGLFIWRNI